MSRTFLPDASIVESFETKYDVDGAAVSLTEASASWCTAAGVAYATSGSVTTFTGTLQASGGYAITAVAPHEPGEYRICGHGNDGTRVIYLRTDVLVVTASGLLSVNMTQTGGTAYVAGAIPAVAAGAAGGLGINLATEVDVRWASSNSASGAVLKAAVTGAAAGQVIRVGAGTFSSAVDVLGDIGGLTIRGAGREQTILSFDAENANLIKLGVGETLSDLTINGTLTGIHFQYPVYLVGNTVCRNLHLIAGADGFIGTFTTTGSAFIEDCVVDSLYDCFNVFLGTYELNRVQFRAIGPWPGIPTTRAIVGNGATIYCRDSLLLAKNASGTGGYTYGVDAGISAATTVYLFNTHIHVSDTANRPVAGLYARSGHATNIFMFGGSIRTVNGNGTDLAVLNAGTGKIVLVGVDYDRTKTSNTSTGSIIDIASGATDSAGHTIQAAAAAAITAAAGVAIPSVAQIQSGLPLAASDGSAPTSNISIATALLDAAPGGGPTLRQLLQIYGVIIA